MNLNPHIAAVIAQFDYAATGTNQISFSAGDKLIVAAADAEVVEQGEDWVFARHAVTLEEGFVPSNFLKITSAEEESRLQILADIRDLKYQLDAELHFKDGLRDIIRRSKDENEKTVARESLADSERRIDEIEEQLDKLEAAYKQAKFDENFQDNEEHEEEEDEDEDYESEPVPPIQPFTGEVKSILKTTASESKKNVRFNSPKTMSEIHEEIHEERKIAATRPAEDPPAPNQKRDNTPSQPAPVAPPRKASLDAAASNGTIPPPKPRERSTPRKKTVSVADLESPTLKGYLSIYQTSGLKSWSKRYCVLKDSVLYMYKKPTDSDTYDKVVLPSYTVSPCSIGGKQWAFKAEHAGCKSFIIGAENKEEFTSWLNALSLATIVMSIEEARPASTEQSPSAADTKRKRRSIEGAREGLALKAFRNSITHFDDD